MDFSVGIAVLVLVTVLVVAVIGYGIYLNRRHDQWESVVGHVASDTQSRGLGVSNFYASQQTPHMREKSGSTKSPRLASPRATSNKTQQAKQTARVAPTVNTPQGKSAKSKISTDTPELPHMSIEDVYRGGIPMTEGIIRHEVKGKRSDVFSVGAEKRKLFEKKVDENSMEKVICATNENVPARIPNSERGDESVVPLVEGIVGGVVKKHRDETNSTIASGQRWTKENNAHILKTNQSKTARTTTKSLISERVVPLRKGSTKILSNGASKARHENSGTSTEKSRLEEYVVLRVSGKHANAFPLRELARFMLNRSLKFDNIGLFSMHDEDTDELMFKVADVYSPGQFDRAQIETYCTEGLTFIMCLAPLSNPQQSFEQMLSLASECARCFDAIVSDEHSNKLSNQTITHYRYRVADFRRKKMSM